MWSSGPRILFIVLAVICSAASERRDDEIERLKEHLKLEMIRLNTATAQHTLELSNIKKDMDDMKEEMKTYKSCNDQRNSQITLEWAMNAVSELKREMKEVEAANNASGWQQELRNEVATILAEAEGVTKLAAADGARLAAGEARHAELMLDVRQIREMATAARHACDSLKDDMKRAHSEYKNGLKLLNNKIYYINSGNRLLGNQKLPDDIDFDYKRFRHMRSLGKQLQELKKMHKHMFKLQVNMKNDIDALSDRVTSIKVNDKFKVEQIFEEQEKHSSQIQNITAEIGNFDKMHASMLELLENMETLENKIDKTIPDFKKEISKLDVDMITMRSHNQNLKEDHENVHQTIKAIAVTVSNLVDKVNEDHQIFERLNATNKDNAPRLLSEFRDYKDAQKRFDTIGPYLPASCDDVEDVNQHSLIAPSHGSPVITACEYGWTLVQQRIDGSLDFNKNYQEYETGFGDPKSEFWIGNDALHRLTSENCSSLRVNMIDVQGISWYAEYSYFRVASSSAGYRLNIAGYSGNASNALEFQNGMEFSTIDNDQDNSKHNCAANYEGGWWFSHCQHVNLNGKYSLGLTWFNSPQNKGIEVARSRIMVRKNDKCTS